MRFIIAVTLLCSILWCSAKAYSDFAFEVTYPNGGQTFAVGDSLAVKVTTSDQGSLCIITINIGKMSFPIPGQTTQFRPALDSIHIFKIPAFFTSIADTGTGQYHDTTSTISDTCQIQLSEYNTPSNYDVSDSFFSIIAAPIVITSAPTGSFRVGDSILIAWRTVDRISGCMIEASSDNSQSWQELTGSPITRQSSFWQNFSTAIPASFEGASACKIRVRADDNSFSAVSLETFIVEKQSEKKHSGCGSGFGLAFIPAVMLKLRRFRKRK